MTRSLSIVSIFLFVVSAIIPTRADDFSSPQVGFRISTPAGWHSTPADAETGTFHTLEGPEGRIRLHLYRPDAKTPEEALKFSAAKHEEIHEKLRKSSPGFYLLLASNPFHTKAGLAGVKGSFGYEHRDRPIVNKHFVPNSAGRIVCICVDRCKSIKDYDLLEQAIIQTIQQTPPEA